MSATKRCPDCQRDLPTDEYPFRNRAKSYRHSYCKSCLVQRVMAARRKDPTAQRRALRRYHASPKGQANRLVAGERRAQRAQLIRSNKGALYTYPHRMIPVLYRRLMELVRVYPILLQYHND